MRVLSLAPHVPFEGVPHAGGQYLLRHLEALARRHDVTLLVPESEDPLAAGRTPPAWLDSLVPPLELASRSRRRVVADAVHRRLMGVPPAPSRQSLRAVRGAGLVQLAAAADVVELHWAEYARFATELRRAGVRTPVCVVEHDVDIEVYARRIREHIAGYRQQLALLTAPMARRREVRGLSDADLVLLFKAADEQVLRRAGVRTAVQVIDPWLDEPATGVERRERSVLFTGAMWRRENAEGASWFLREVWPRVLERAPDAALVLAGAGPGQELKDAAERATGVEVTGEVPDLLPYYGRAAVFVAPLFAGGGLKFKVAQALRSGLPVVATTNAAQGVVEHAPPGTLWAVTDDPAAQADALLAAFDDPTAASRAGRAAGEWARSWWSFERAMDAVEARYEQLAAGR